MDRDTRLRLNQLASRQGIPLAELRETALLEYLREHEEGNHEQPEKISYASLQAEYPAVYHFTPRTYLEQLTLWFPTEYYVCDSTGRIRGRVYHIGKYAYILNSDTLGTEIPEDRQASYAAELRKVTSIPALERLVERMNRELKPDQK